jgi:hypothetical protein
MNIKQQEEQTWPKITDCDKINTLFENLNSKGIIALQNAGYTMSDGHSDVNEIIAERKGNNIIGYCFYYGQDLKRSVIDQGLTLAFGGLKNSPEESSRVANLICTSIKENGFDHDWNGDPKNRITIFPLLWKRRFSS